MIVILLLCLFLVAIGLWLYFQPEPQFEPEPQVEPEPETDILTNLIETANIERQIEQLEADKSPPEIEKLEELVQSFENDTTRWDILIAVADIYKKGAYPRFLPNEELAIQIYKIASMCPNGEVAGMAQAKYIETYDDPINNIDKKGDEFPLIYGTRIIELAEGSIKTTPWHLFEKPKMQNQEPTPMFIDRMEDFQEILWNTPQTVTVPEYRIDSQNVHDHAISKITAFNIDKLKDNQDIRNIGQTMEKVTDAILSHDELDANTKETALHVLDNLNDSVHSSFDISEKQALSMVWDKIDKNQDLKQNLTETLAKQLASAVENGHVVCSSGKITRIMSTLDGISNEPSRPMWAIREELANTASKIREDMTRQYGDTPEAGKRMKEEFNSTVRKEYIDKLQMSAKIIEPLISEYEIGF